MWKCQVSISLKKKKNVFVLFAEFFFFLNIIMNNSDIGWRHDASVIVSKLVKRSFLLLVLLALIVSCITFSMAQLVFYAWVFQNYLLNDTNWAPWIRFIMTTFLRLVFVLASVTMTYLLSPEAAGNEMTKREIKKET